MKSGAEIVYVAMGSNLGDRAAVFAAVLRDIQADSDLELLASSPVFETDPVGPGEQGAYLNAAISLQTALTPLELLERLQRIELAHGRDRSDAAERWGPRVIDLDILFYGDRCIETPRLVVPHPRAHERSFVLAPMAALAPDLTHPGLGRSMRALLDSLPDLESARLAPSPPGWPRPAATPARPPEIDDDG
jgi:2-amino-4-hydroxy-6-hydroxymethyldihydropteridine diphosphokinase